MKNHILDFLLSPQNDIKEIFIRDFTLNCQKNDHFSFKFLLFCYENKELINLNYYKKDSFNINTSSDFSAFFIENWSYFSDHFYSEAHNEFEIFKLSKMIFNTHLSIKEIEDIFLRLPFIIDFLSNPSCFKNNIMDLILFCSQGKIDFIKYGSIFSFDLDKSDFITLEIIKNNSLLDKNIPFLNSFFYNFDSITNDLKGENNVISRDFNRLFTECNKKNSYSIRCFYIFKLLTWIERIKTIETKFIFTINYPPSF